MGLTEEIRKAQAQRKRWLKVAERKDAKGDELVKAIREVREEIARKRERRRELEDGTRHPDWSEDQRDERREALADQIDELEGHLDRLAERLDLSEGKEQEAVEEALRLRDRIVRLRKRRQEIRENNRDRLSEHFHRAEFDCRDGTPVPEAAMPALRALCQDFLEPLRASGGVVYINSGYRTRSYNAAVGGVGNSVHIYDEKPEMVAADLMQSGRTPSQVADFHEANPEDNDQAIGLGRYATFTHIDNRGRGGWAESRWFG
jgi:predicted RNase H-like nuclease (RuvC/YqgF family)